MLIYAMSRINGVTIIKALINGKVVKMVSFEHYRWPLEYQCHPVECGERFEKERIPADYQRVCRAAGNF